MKIVSLIERRVVQGLYLLSTVLEGIESKAVVV